jgi:hypothetical protein
MFFFIIWIVLQILPGKDKKIKFNDSYKKFLAKKIKILAHYENPIFIPQKFPLNYPVKSLFTYLMIFSDLFQFSKVFLFQPNLTMGQYPKKTVTIFLKYTFWNVGKVPYHIPYHIPL